MKTLKLYWQLGVLPLVCLASCSEQLRSSHILFALSISVPIGLVFAGQYSKAAWMDSSVIVMLAAVIVSYLSSTYRPTGLEIAASSFEAALLYFIVRTTRKWAVSNLIASVCTFGIAIECLFLFTFHHRYLIWKDMYFSDLTSFRRQVSLFSSASYVGAQDAIFLLIILLSFTLSVRSSKKLHRIICILAICFSAICVILTFRRTVYIAAACLFLLAILALVQNRHEIALTFTGGERIAACIGAMSVLAVSLTFSRPLSSTAKLMHTDSQVRSAREHIDSTREGAALFMDHKWMGVGLGNYSHAVRELSYKYSSEYEPQSFNWIIEAAAEQGLLGILALGLAAVGVFRELTKARAIYRQLYCAGLLSLIIFGFGEADWGQSRCFYDLLAITAGVLPTLRPA